MQLAISSQFALIGRQPCLLVTLTQVCKTKAAIKLWSRLSICNRVGLMVRDQHCVHVCISGLQCISFVYWHQSPVQPACMWVINWLALGTRAAT